MYRYIVLIFAIFFIFSTSVRADSGMIDVSISVHCDDISLKNEIKSCILLYLRRLGDINVVLNNYPDVNVDIFAVNAVQNNNITGVAVSYVISDKYKIEMFKNIIKDEFKNDSILYMLSDVYSSHNSGLILDTPDKIESICSDIVNTMDVDHFQAERLAKNALNNID